MLGPKILPAILIVLSLNVLLLGRGGAGTATPEECSTEPSSSAPQGTHWYYRVNRANNRRCWFLGSEGLKVRSPAREAVLRLSAPGAMPQQGNPSEPTQTRAPQTAPAQTASVQVVHARVLPADAASIALSMPAPATAVDFAARWSDLPEFTSFDAPEPGAMSNSFADTQMASAAADQVSLSWPIIETGRAGQRANAAIEALLASVILAGSLGLASLLFAGRGFRFARCAGQPRLRDPWRAVAGRLSSRWGKRVGLTDPADCGWRQTRHDNSVRRAPWPADPAHDLQTSLEELMQDLHRAEAASSSPRSFAPPARHTRQRAADETRQVHFTAHSRFARQSSRAAEAHPAARAATHKASRCAERDKATCDNSKINATVVDYVADSRDGCALDDARGLVAAPT